MRLVVGLTSYDGGEIYMSSSSKTFRTMSDPQEVFPRGLGI